ncbi:RNA polymerase sigma factor [Cohnella abietis]|uniref:RNA polymerase sigma factor n=1 Tax=Cohnella abietis TaxID=2507935 RepID=A0A3T1D286_9BACL|nr:sigma-70 family RNA polymerase sigma factor [Cohnella abietis]BBI32222.1 RNA polymerase sigma factor [Cohnella abietis]
MNFLRDSNLPEAFWSEDEVLGELYTQMLKVVRHKLWHKSDAGDVVQEAWVRILEKRSTLRHKEKLIPWAKAIASNLASNANRARRHEKMFDHLEDEFAGTTPVFDSESMMELSDLLGRLDPVTRTLLLYKFYYGLKDAEIASALQLPVGTVKARIHRGKARLKTQAKAEESHT